MQKLINLIKLHISMITQFIFKNISSAHSTPSIKKTTTSEGKFRCNPPKHVLENDEKCLSIVLYFFGVLSCHTTTCDFSLFEDYIMMMI